jgi:hypothetical protein
MRWRLFTWRFTKIDNNHVYLLMNVPQIFHKDMIIGQVSIWGKYVSVFPFDQMSE